MNIYIVILVQQLFASGTHLFAKTVTGEISPVLLLFLRNLVSLSAWSILFIVREKEIRIEKEDWWPMLRLCVLAVPLNQFFYLYGIKFTLAGDGALLYALTPAIVLVCSRFLLGERMSRSKIIGVIIAFAGVTVVMFEKGLDFSGDYFFGNCLISIAVTAWALYAIYGKKMVIKYGAFHISSLSMIGGAILVIPFGIVGTAMNGFPSISLTGWMGILYLGLGTSVISYLLWFYALGKLDATRVTVFSNSQPIFTTIMAVIFLSQPVTISFMIGGAITIGGVLLTQKK